MKIMYGDGSSYGAVLSSAEILTMMAVTAAMKLYHQPKY